MSVQLYYIFKMHSWTPSIYISASLGECPARREAFQGIKKVEFVLSKNYSDVFARDWLGFRASPPLLQSPIIVCFSLLCNAVSLPEHFVFLRTTVFAIVYVFSIGMTFGIRGCAH